MAALTKPTLKINNKTYEAVPSVKIQGITDSTGTYDDLDFYWTGDATISAASQLLTGIKAYGPNGVITGNIPSKTSADLTVSGATVTAPAGYYASSASKSVASGSVTPVATIGTSSYLDSTSSYTFTVTPSATLTEGYITEAGTGTVVTGHIKAGTASAPLTITDASNALTGSLTDGTPKITTSITPSVTAGWITSVATSGTGDKYIKKGTVTLSASRTGGTALVDNNGTYTVIIGASGTTTAGWVGSNPTAASATIKIKDAGISNFDMISGNNTNSRVDVSIGHMVSSTPTNYEGYVKGGTATISYSVLASANIASQGGTDKTLFQVQNQILNGTTILGVAGSVPTLDQDYVTDEIGAYNDDDNLYLSIPNTGYYSTQAGIYATFAGTDSILAAWDDAKGTHYNTNRTSTDVTASGKTVTVPVGYYNTQVTKDVSTGTASVDAAATSSYISDDSSTAGSTTYKITVNANPSITEGWITSIGGTATKDYYVKVQSKSVTLSGTAQTITPDTGKLLSSVSVPAVSLSAANIKTGVTYYGTTGTFTADATATASQILSGATAYVNGSKVTGTIANGSVTYTANTSTAVTTGAGYYATAVTTNVPSVTQDGTTKVLTIA